MNNFKFILKPFFRIYISIIKSFTRSGMYKWLGKAIDDHYNNEMTNVLNIGHGGPVYDYIKKLKIKNLKSIDLNPDLDPDIILSIEDMNLFNDSSVDIIICMEVLEHVKNPFNASKEIQRVLKPNGILIASTVFIYPLHEIPNDFYRFTRYGVDELFKDMKKIDLQARNRYFLSIYSLLLRLGMNNRKRIIISSLIIFPFLLILTPLFLIMNILFDTEYSTTGYYFIFKKIK